MTVPLARHRRNQQVKLLPILKIFALLFLRSRGRLRPLQEDNTLFLIFFGQADFDRFIFRRLDMLPDVIGLDGEFAVAAIDQNRQLDSLRPAEIHEPVQGRANRPACVKNIIYGCMLTLPMPVQPSFCQNIAG